MVLNSGNAFDLSPAVLERVPTIERCRSTAQLGHVDRTSSGNTSWNPAHPSRSFSQENLDMSA
jgi:hypothetical protein